MAGIVASAALLGSLTAWQASALPGPDESTVVSVSPERIMDTRDPTNVGLAGPFVSAVSQDLTVTGEVATTTGAKTVVPVGATGVLLNVTVVGPTARGFISVRPADAPGLPTTSTLNFEVGAVVPNAAQVNLPRSGADAGKIEITYDAYGTPGPTTDILIDVVGYTTNQGLMDLVAELAKKANVTDVYTRSETDALLSGKANASDVYTKAEADAAFAPIGDLTFNHGTSQLTATSSDPAEAEVVSVGGGAVVTGDGVVGLSLTGPASIGGKLYVLDSIEYCITALTLGQQVVTVRLNEAQAASVVDATVRGTAGCYTVPDAGGLDAFGVIIGSPLPPFGYDVEFVVDSPADNGSVRFVGLRSYWTVVPVP